jgi:molybdopterin-guanine dinucleotide biosynthesis protein B
MKVFGLVGWSGSGKTTLLVRLLPELIGRGLRVSTMKHTHHNVDIDKPGKDSFEHRQAGATEVLLAGARRWALLCENRNGAEPSIDALLTRMAEVDLVLIEGFKSYPHQKLEVHRPAVGKPLLAKDDPSIVAVACDLPLEGIGRPVMDLNDVGAVADFIVGHLGLQTKVRNGAA